MLRVALTGGLGSGKSAAADLLRERGAYVSSSDEVGRALMQPGEPAFRAIVEHFGEDVLLPDGFLDRAALARIAFHEGRVEELNSIIHPLVIAWQARWFEEIEGNDPLAVAVVESALVFETKHAATDDAAPWRTRFDRIVVVTAPLAMRRERYIRRVMGSDSSRADEFMTVAGNDFDQRAAAQWTDERKSALADYVLVNDGSLERLEMEVERLWQVLKAESMDRAAEAM